MYITHLSNKYGITFAIHNVRAHVKHSTLNYFVQTLQTELHFLSTINVLKIDLKNQLI